MLKTRKSQLRLLRTVSCSLFLTFLLIVQAGDAASRETFRGLTVDAGAISAEKAPEIAGLAREGGFTHLVVQLPFFRGGQDREALAILRRWSSLCEINRLRLVPKWAVCGPKDLILSDPFFELELTPPATGSPWRSQVSPLQDAYWQDALFSKVEAVLRDSQIVTDEICLDFTITVDGKRYGERDGYDDSLLATFPPVANTSMKPEEKKLRVQEPDLEAAYRRHVIERIAHLFRSALDRIDMGAREIRFSIDRYFDNRIYEGIARGLARPGRPTRCFLIQTERHYGRTSLLDALTANHRTRDVLRFAPRLDVTLFRPSEAAWVTQESARAFGGYLAIGLDAAWRDYDDLRPVDLPKAKIADLIRHLAAVQNEGREPERSDPTVPQLRAAQENESVYIRGPLNRNPLFPGGNDVRFEIGTVLPDLKSAQLEVELIHPDLSVDPRIPLEIKLLADGRTEFAVPVETRRSGWHQLLFTARHPVTRVILARDSFALQALPTWDAELDKSYYTRENSARIRVRRHDGGAVESLDPSAVLKVGDGELRARYVPGEDNAVGFLEFDLDSCPPGTHAVSVHGGTSNSGMKKIPLSLIVRPPHFREVKFLRHRGNVLEVDGKPRFALGGYYLDTVGFAAMGATGANASISHIGGTSSEIEATSRDARSAGIGVGVHPPSIHEFLKPGHDDEAEHLRALDCEAAMFYYNVDEPEVNNISVQSMTEMYEFIRSHDPYRPQATVIYGHNEDYERFTPPYIPTVDILMMDYYPLARGPMTRFDYGMKRARIAAAGEIPVWSVPQGFDWRAFGNQPFDPETYSPNEREFRYACYSTVVQGGRGIVFWSTAVLRRHPPMVEVFKNVLSEFSRLHDILVEEDALLRFTLSPCTDALNARAKWSGGKLYLFATNGDWFPTEARFEFQDFKPASIVELRSGKTFQPVEYQDRTQAGADAPMGFVDEIEAAGVRVYVIEPRPKKAG